MAKKYYVVWEGKKTGIFATWDECKESIHGFQGAVYKSFESLTAAAAAFKNQSKNDIFRQNFKEN